jgi:hypothetical protein
MGRARGPTTRAGAGRVTLVFATHDLVNLRDVIGSGPGSYPAPTTELRPSARTAELRWGARGPLDGSRPRGSSHTGKETGSAAASHRPAPDRKQLAHYAHSPRGAAEPISTKVQVSIRWNKVSGFGLSVFMSISSRPAKVKVTRRRALRASTEPTAGRAALRERVAARRPRSPSARPAASLERAQFARVTRPQSPSCLARPVA